MDTKTYKSQTAWKNHNTGIRLSSSSTFMDIRYNFLNTLDHFPCELIRTLWTLQSLDLSLDQTNEDEQKQIALQMENQADFLQDLVQGRIKALRLQREELCQMQDIRRRYDATRSRTLARDPSLPPPLTIKLNLKELPRAQRKPQPRPSARPLARTPARTNVTASRVAKPQRRHHDGAGTPNIRRKEEPREQTYCVCHNVSYGSMIACDNQDCPTEWFHYGCVGIVRPLEGEWYCSDRCRRAASNAKRGKRTRRQRA